MEENRNDMNFDNINSNTNNTPANSGYTVTPEGGYYTYRHKDIIQDEPNPAQSNAQSQTSANTSNTQPHQTETPPNNSGYYNPNYNPNFNSNYYAAQNNYKPPKPKKEKKHYSAAIVIIASVLAAIIGAIGGAASAMMISNDNSTHVSPQKNNSNVNITVDKNATSVVEAVAEKAGNSVVGIRTTTSVNNFFFGSSDQTGSGSGVVYSSDGYIITNYHVIEDVVQSGSKGKIEVFIGDSDSTPYTANVIGYSISTDLAVLKINATGLTPIEIGNSDDLKVGQFVIAMGSPGGLDFRGSVTYGVVSGLNRVVSSDSEVKLIQTDAAINPGNSGGALLDTNGRLIGINSSKIVSTGFEGMGFSIPVNTVIEKCEKMISKQSKPEPYIGISLSKKYTKDVLSYYGFPNGAVVLSVNPDGPADKAGICRGDIITEFNGKEVKSPDLLEELISECQPKNTVKVKLYRSGRYYSTEIEVMSNN